MPSQIKVDEIKNVAGQYKIKTNVFEGQTNAGSIAVQGEGTATTNLQQGLSKHWISVNMSTAAVNDSFNAGSLTDNGTGDFTNTLTASAHPSIESPTKNLLVFLGMLISGNFSI